MLLLIDEFGHRCDERCYNAKHMTCHCVCGGRNHGVGLKQAIKNTIELDKSLSQLFEKNIR